MSTSTAVKTCGRCRVEKALDDFARNRATPTGRASWCRSCSKDYRVARRAQYAVADRARYVDRRRDVERSRRYGVDPEAFAELLAEQSGGCAICGLVPGSDDEALCVDHDHETGAVRGLLCRRCNSGIGHLADDADRVRSALAYLERFTP